MRAILVIYLLLFVAASLSAQQMMSAWNTNGDDYAPCWNREAGGWVITQTSSGQTSLMRAIEMQGSLTPMRVLGFGAGASIGCLTVAENGEAYAVTYRMLLRQNHATVYRVFVEGNAITVGDPIDQLMGDWFTSYPAISPDGNRLVVVSDRPGGAGGTDLWVLEKLVDGTWGQPQHAGESINTSADETSPFLVSSDTLLFSSNGFGGAGGMDVFMSVYQAGRWGDPVPVDKLNSPFDDTDAVVAPNGATFFCRRGQQRSGIDVLMLP